MACVLPGMLPWMSCLVLFRSQYHPAPLCLCVCDGKNYKQISKMGSQTGRGRWIMREKGVMVNINILSGALGSCVIWQRGLAL